MAPTETAPGQRRRAGDNAVALLRVRLYLRV